MTDTARTEPMAPDSLGAQDRPPPRRRLRGSPLRIVVLVLAAGFFCLPGVGYLLGVRAQQIENRPLTTRPTASEGWKIFPHLNAWTSDHLPFRDKAVRLNADVDQGLFGAPPGQGTNGRSEVISGKDGWLFFTQDVDWACAPQQPTASTLRAADRLAKMVRATGANYALFVPPDKTSIETAELPSRYPGKACSTAAKRDFWAQMASNPPDGYTDLYQRLQQLRASRGAPIYRSKDSHWAPESAGIYAQELADAARRGLWQPQDLVPTGPQRALGDLTRFTGIPGDNTFDGYATRRPGVTSFPYEPGKVGTIGIATLRSSSAPAGAPLYTDQALLLGDSFSGISEPQWTPYFSKLVSVSINAAPKDPKDVATMILSSKVVFVESVERAFATGRAPLFTDAFLDKLQVELDKQRAARP
ncbi:MAG: hypothetical protein QOJ32_319 [Frankiaceae bacterium]|nr:hypothetical protein [Frankiaceae bacterium]MDQ1648356.1 hypothetical protein [Frankiaceae bacterium]